MKNLLWKIVLICAIPAYIHCGYEAMKIIKYKDVGLSILTALLFLGQALESLSELMKDE